MPVVAEHLRFDALRRLGLSDLLLRLSAGEPVHPLLALRCDAPPYFSYHGAEPPAGPPFVPLWDCGDTVTGVRPGDGGLEFVAYAVEGGEPDVLARTEAGLWATVFLDLYEADDTLDVDGLRPAAAAVGFTHLDGLIAAYERADTRTFDGRERFTREVVRWIDSGAT